MKDGEHRGRGTLVLVVGPSGAGKDTLLTLARTRLGADRRFVFPRRVVTRQAGAHEDHDTLDPAAFAAAAEAGRFLLHWQAHGLSYGIAAAAGDDLRAGRTVTANVSRGVIGVAGKVWPRLRVVLVTAPPEVLARRIAARGRDAETDAQARLVREGAPLPVDAAVTTIVNDGSPDTGADRLVDVLLATQTDHDQRR
jgi:ribose 1,5-bisphosphokinase